MKLIVPLDRGLNVAILHIASRLFPRGFDVSDTAPQTYEQLKTHLDTGNRMLVWSGGSETTIYGDREVNYAFRAWHDWCHWRASQPFTPEGELAVSRIQRAHLLSLYPGHSKLRTWSAILTADTWGQQRHFYRHRCFPHHQKGFVIAYLRGPERALAIEW